MLRLLETVRRSDKVELLCVQRCVMSTRFPTRSQCHVRQEGTVVGVTVFGDTVRGVLDGEGGRGKEGERDVGRRGRKSEEWDVWREREERAIRRETGEGERGKKWM